MVQSDAFNRSRIRTTIIAVITSNMRLADAPGNVILTRRQSGLSRDSVVNVSQLLTLDRAYVGERIGNVPAKQLTEIEHGLRLVLSLDGGPHGGR